MYKIQVHILYMIFCINKQTKAINAQSKLRLYNKIEKPTVNVFVWQVLLSES